MKNLFLKFLILPFIFFCFAFTPVSSETPAKIEAFTLEDEGLHCRIKNDRGGVIASCWFCNCSKLAEAARQ